MFSSIEGLNLTYHVAEDGTLMGIAGHEQLAEAMREKLPAPPSRSMIQMLNYDSLRRQDETAHREVPSDVPGSSFEVGVARAAAWGHALPCGGSIPL